jgi:hypothetical protein
MSSSAQAVNSSRRTGPRDLNLDLDALARLVGPVGGAVYCHAPADRPFDLHALDRPDDPADRWSAPGARSVYLAGDPLVAVAEYARHGPAQTTADDRRLVRLQLRSVAALDLRAHVVRAALGLGDGLGAYADRDLARRHALAIRMAGISAAIVVPSMAFLDQPDRRNVVLFCERVDGGLESVLGDPVEVGRLQLGG